VSSRSAPLSSTTRGEDQASAGLRESLRGERALSGAGRASGARSRARDGGRCRGRQCAVPASVPAAGAGSVRGVACALET
jgi:hypothetical protein